MASYPTFDNRWFGAGITNDKFQQLFPPEDKNIPFDQRPPSPLVNRAIQGRYNVGSAYKAFTAYAALHTGFMGSNEVYTDVGVYELPEASCDREQVAKCSFKNAFNFATGAPTTYGDVTISDALAVSSDAFFYRVGAELFLANLGTPVLQNEYKLFGFGEKSGIELPFEYRGIVPDAAVRPASPSRTRSPTRKARASTSATPCRWRSARDSRRRHRCSSRTPTPRSPTADSC